MTYLNMQKRNLVFSLPLCHYDNHNQERTEYLASPISSPKILDIIFLKRH